MPETNAESGRETTESGCETTESGRPSNKNLEIFRAFFKMTALFIDRLL